MSFFSLGESYFSARPCGPDKGEAPWIYFSRERPALSLGLGYHPKLQCSRPHFIHRLRRQLSYLHLFIG